MGNSSVHLAFLFNLLITSKALIQMPRHLIRRFTLHSALKEQAKHFKARKGPITKEDSNAQYFDFSRIETDVYKWWEESEYFKPAATVSKRKPFVIPMPPPNDIMARFQRMRGRETLWLPGTDHAGIATQLLVERSLAEQGIKRRDIGREAFLERVWAWKEEKGDYITKQMRRLGASADWSRERFTLEANMSAAVTEAFVRLHEKGLVYRGDYLVNWSPNLQTAVSDLEVDYSEEEGKLYFFKYMLSDGSGRFIPVSTTRPETILGDTAVCVHPDDERYKEFVGKTVKVPMCDRDIPVIADAYVDMSFGTGGLKVTPAHDPNDYEIGKRHDLPLINIMNKDASINHIGGERYAGLDRFACRARLWADLESEGLAIKAEAHMQRVPRSQRGGEIIEPMVSAQWFVRMQNMGERAARAVRDKDITIVPERFEKVWYNWLDNIHDWCVSRQLWWGHRIPVYYTDESRTEYIVARSPEEAMQAAKAKYGDRDVNLIQDEDVLDTWFSSGLWPFATVGWPDNDAPDLARFYPASVLETGYDILFFWVARMVMMGLQFTDKSPFHTIYLHGLVRDAKGQKMSKTTGNVIDPLDTIDKYGCDTLRYSLVSATTAGQDVPLSMERIESNRNFINKLWNVGKYLSNVLSTLSEEERSSLSVTRAISAAELTSLPALADRYIISACHMLVKSVTKEIEEFNFAEASRQLYDFLWNEFADWYIEASKTRLRDAQSEEAQRTRKVLIYVWDTSLRILHPFTPFIAETLWQLAAPRADVPSIMVAPWPQLTTLTDDGVEIEDDLAVDVSAISAFHTMQGLVRAIRNARAEYATQPGKKIAAFVYVAEGDAGDKLIRELETERASLALLARLDESLLKIQLNSKIPEADQSNCVHLVVEDGLEVFIPMADMVDREKEIQRLTKQAEKLKKDINLLENRMSSESYLANAPKSVVEEARASLGDKRDQLEAIGKSLAQLAKV